MPRELRGKVLELGHEEHPGATVMKRRMRAKVWWPRMDDDIEKNVKSCRGCTLVSAANPPEPMKTHPLPDGPWQHVAIDFMGPIEGSSHILVVVDYYSRYKEVQILTQIDAKTTIKTLQVIFARFGFPLVMWTDNGPQFDCHEFKSFCTSVGIKLNPTIPYWPQQNGEVERQNRSLLKRLKIGHNLFGDWKRDLLDYLLMYRSTPHSTTGKTPSELMFGWNIRDKLPGVTVPMDVEEGVKERD